MGIAAGIGAAFSTFFSSSAFTAISSIAQMAFSAFGGSGGGGGASAPSIPQFQAPPRAPSVDTSADDLELVADDAAKKAAGQKGGQQSILTSGTGVVEEKTSKTLLGD